MKRTPELTHERLLDVLQYNPVTGVLRWLKHIHVSRIGKRAGWINKANHRQISVDGEHFYTGPLIWFYMTGQWPTYEIDHKNRDGADDRWENLRHATRSQNCANRRLPTKFASNSKGVYRLGPSWVAHIKINKKFVHLGCFETKEAAAAAFQQAQREAYGEFAHASSI